jgi:hypothetical protein
MRPLLAIVVSAALLLSVGAAGQTPADPAYPSFLPGYFASVLNLKGEHLTLAEHTDKDDFSRYIYTTDDQVVSVAVERLLCDSAKCATVLDNALRFFNKQATDNGGRFRALTGTEFGVEWHAGLGGNTSFVLKLPGSILFWSYASRLDRNLAFESRFKTIVALANHQRYDDALPRGNIEFGWWAPQVRDYAHQLLADGRKQEALSVLKNLLPIAPFDYEAQLDFAESTGDAAAAKSSAQAAFNNAEDVALVARAGRILKLAATSAQALPVLSEQETGLQLILIPLPPCDVALVEQAAGIYEKITNIPVKVARLGEDWQWEAPDRSPDQKRIQQAILQERGPSVDFSGWTQERYTAALLETVASKDALTKFSTETFIDKLPTRPSQYRVDPYLDRLIDLLAKHRSYDIRTMYVGVTANNIYSGDSNYFFSAYNEKDGAGAGILSYSMMLAQTLGEPLQSRKRLTERMAKELVPPSLSALGIPRPADPTDPYSYSNGVDRLGQKSLTLSDPTREALEKFRSLH